MKRIFLCVLFTLTSNCFADIDCEKGASNAAQVEACNADVKEKKINAIVAELNKKFSLLKNNDAMNALKQSQAGWVAYRSGTCELVAESIKNSYTGTNKTMGLAELTAKGEKINSAGVSCFTRITDERIKFLTSLSKNFK